MEAGMWLLDIDVLWISAVLILCITKSIDDMDDSQEHIVGDTDTPNKEADII